MTRLSVEDRTQHRVRQGKCLTGPMSHHVRGIEHRIQDGLLRGIHAGHEELIER